MRVSLSSENGELAIHGFSRTFTAISRAFHGYRVRSNSSFAQARRPLPVSWAHEYVCVVQGVTGPAMVGAGVHGCSWISWFHWPRGWQVPGFMDCAWFRAVMGLSAVGCRDS
eukprot:1256981-Alexandrium_andersonii.AAC.1